MPGVTRPARLSESPTVPRTLQSHCQADSWTAAEIREREGEGAKSAYLKAPGGSTDVRDVPVDEGVVLVGGSDLWGEVIGGA